MDGANKKAWDAAHKSARTVLKKQTKNRKYEPLGSIWYEISAQLRQHGDYVDVDESKLLWTSESHQRQLMIEIMEKAGFSADDQDPTIYRWKKKSRKSESGKDGKS